jgi:AraC-like DNA-binding protein
MTKALRTNDLRAALRICERIERALRSRAELSTPPPAPRAAHAGVRSDGRVRLSKLAGRLGMDPRTLLKHIAEQDFVENPVPRVWLVHESRFEHWYAEHGRKLR